VTIWHFETDNLLKGYKIKPEIINQIAIESRIYLVRGTKVMLDSDLAELYDVETRILNQSIQRNRIRFPEDFMFQLTADEAELLRSQIVISNKGRGGRRYLPFVFTENGVAMLSSVLNSDRAILVNIQIMRAFTRIRNLVADNVDLRKAIQQMERRLGAHDQQIQVAFAALKGLLQAKPVLPASVGTKEYPPDERKKMGFGKAGKNEGRGRKEGRKAGW
jgi:hypothetical protein